MAAFSSLTDRLSNAFKHLKSKGKLSEADIDGTIREIRRALLDADVALDVVRSFTSRIRERALGTEVSEALNPAQQVVKIVNEELTAVLGAGVDRPLNFAKNPPTIIMLAGLQGAGKTTLAGKLGYWLKDSGHTPLLVAADLQRPNAVTQLQVVGERAGVPVYAPEKGVQSDGGEAVVSPGQTTGDPVKVARDAVELAKQKLYDTVIIDTAGRLGVDEELMKQARDIRDTVQPNEILFVIDAMIGQDAVQTAKAFDEGVDFTGVVLSKLDGDARGGAALSVASVTGKPILFASTGEGLKDFEVFHPDRMASRILDMGDILTLIEQAQKQFDEEEARKAAEQAPRPEPQPEEAESTVPLNLEVARSFAQVLKKEKALMQDERAVEELDHMQKTTQAICDWLEAHPESLPKARRFAEYYIPTTLKLLHTYNDVQGQQGENAEAIRRDIAGILHTLNQAYDNLYDNLLSDVALDVSSEIAALQGMLANDGLTGEGML